MRACRCICANVITTSMVLETSGLRPGSGCHGGLLVLSCDAIQCNCDNCAHTTSPSSTKPPFFDAVITAFMDEQLTLGVHLCVYEHECEGHSKLNTYFCVREYV